LILISFLPYHYIICYVVFIAFNKNHFSILPLMALNSLYCADVPLSNCSLTRENSWKTTWDVPYEYCNRSQC